MRARKLHEHALELSRQLLGGEHPQTLVIMDNLAVTLTAQGNLAGARRLQERALKLSERVLGNQHPTTLIVMHNLAATLKRQGNLAGARKLERDRDLRRRRLGDDAS